ncbi:MAG: translocation/assembly module TamB domain-containing protein [Bacteroidales bacterium]|nr:translocation/assembly module TamB domain-containing protein [Bacteroidales bacterium]
MLLNIPAVQRKITVIATEVLHRQLGVEVKIGGVNVDFINKVILEDLYLEDQSGNPLFEARRVSAGFNFFDLFQKKISFTTVQFFGFDIHLIQRTPNAPLNVQFVIDAFANKDSVRREPLPFSFRFNSVLLRRGNVSYDLLSAPVTPDKFNPQHLSFTDISTKMSIKTASRDSVNLQIKRMSFSEQSGFHLEKLAFLVSANRKEAKLTDFVLLLPQTNLRIPEIDVNYGTVEKPEDFAEKAEFRMQMTSSRIAPREFKIFLPSLKNFQGYLTLQASIEGTANNLNLSECLISLSDKFHLDGTMNLNGITKPENAYIFGKIDHMYITTDGIQDIANSFSDNPVHLPPAIVQLGTIRFDGEISGYFNELVAFGTLHSQLGKVHTDLLFGNNPDKGIKSHFKGSIRTNSFKLGTLIDNPEFGNLSFDMNIDFTKTVNHPIQSTVDANIKELEFKKYKYENLLLSGTFDGSKYTGKIALDDPNARFAAEGMFHLQGDTSAFNFNASIKNINPEALNLTKKYKTPLLSCDINADFQGTNLDALFGSIEISDLQFSTEEASCSIKDFRLEATGSQADKRLQIRSDILNGELVGEYSIRDFVPSLKQMASNYLPALIKTDKKERPLSENNFSIQLDIENTEQLSEALKLPFAIMANTSITGHYNSVYNKIYLTGDLPQFKIGKSIYEDGKLLIENPDKSIYAGLSLSTYVAKKGLTHTIHFSFDAENNALVSDVEWTVNAFSNYKAKIGTTTTFFDPGEKRPLKTLIQLDSTEITLRNNQWKLAPATILIDSGRVAVHNFSLRHAGQLVGLNGCISGAEADSLYLTLRNVELENVFNIIGIPALTFGGIATADLAASNGGGSFSVDGNLNVTDFSFNKARLGELHLYSEWDQALEGIRMMGSIYKSDSIWTDVTGHIFPKKNEISLYFNANDLDISFIHPFIQTVANRFDGNATGLVHLFGDLDHPTIEGSAYVNDGAIGFEMLNTHYTFSDSVYLSPTSIEMRNVALVDPFGNQGIINGVVHHNAFKDFTFDATVNCKNILAYNATSRQSPLIYGQVFGTGMVKLKGDEDVIDINVDMTTDKNTKLKLNFMEASEAVEYNFITFTKEKNLDFLIKKPQEKKRPGPINLYERNKNKNTTLNLSFNVNATPNATVELLVDPQSGDAITATGSGILHVEFGNKKDLSIFGEYVAEQGNYNFTLQQVIRKDFKIREGSSVSFHGNPFATTLDIDAMYNLTANIGDLDEMLVTESKRPNIPVRCILKITGDLQSPDIGFNIELPNSQEEIQRQVMGIINSEDMMNRQIIYLLVLNKFYTPDYTNVTNKSSDLAAVASATLSSQLSHLLSSITDKVQIGTNIRTSDGSFTDTEVDLLLSSQLLNNRLLINGNLGYRDNIANPSTFVGEFDLEYKLTPTGNFRLKAFNHYNDRYYYLKNALTIQGVGIMFKKDFNTLQQMFTPVRRSRRRLQNPAIPPAATMPAEQEIKSEK